jgi:hypothetical protein
MVFIVKKLFEQTETYKKSTFLVDASWFDKILLYSEKATTMQFKFWIKCSRLHNNYSSRYGSS